jgi:hypothetical protein
MKTSYTGLYTIKLADGTITDVQVADPSGNSIPLAIDQYRLRGVLPVAESLPDRNSYKTEQTPLQTEVTNTNHQNKSISLGELADKLGISERPVSMSDIAEKIEFRKRPISLDELNEAVDKHLSIQEALRNTTAKSPSISKDQFNIAHKIDTTKNDANLTSMSDLEKIRIKFIE